MSDPPPAAAMLGAHARVPLGGSGATGEPQLRILAAAREGSGGGLRRRGERCFVGLGDKIQNIVGIVPKYSTYGTSRALKCARLAVPLHQFVLL